jgi:hypothetical protein
VFDVSLTVKESVGFRYMYKHALTDNQVFLSLRMECKHTLPWLWESQLKELCVVDNERAHRHLLTVEVHRTLPLTYASQLETEMAVHKSISEELLISTSNEQTSRGVSRQVA